MWDGVVSSASTGTDKIHALQPLGAVSGDQVTEKEITDLPDQLENNRSKITSQRDI